MKKRITALIVAAVMSLSVLSGCDAQVKAQNLTDGIERDAIAIKNTFEKEQSTAVKDFAVKLLQQSCSQGESTVISPISVLYALAMTANGADGATLSQMEQVFGMDIDTLNEYLYSTVSVLPKDEGYDVDIANSIWIKDDEAEFTVEEEFLQTVKNYYDAGIFMSAFDDATLKDINNWVTQKTNGKIQDILDKIDPDAVMYLVNAINFEADWLNDYTEENVWDGTFTNADGTQQTTEFMHKTERGYIEDGNTTGFIKYYKDKKYAFVAMLPGEDVTVDEYITALSGDKITELLENVRDIEVVSAIPKFETTFDTELSEAFEALGMTDAFNSTVADFSRMGQAQDKEENVCIERIIHKAFIRVAEKGTQAGAATVVEMVTESAMADPPEKKEVILDRPFVYMIVDTQNNLPIFIGTVCSVD